MPVKVLASFQNIEEYEIKVETTMSYAEWKLLLEHINAKWSEPMISFVKPIEAAIKGLEEKVLIKSNGQ